ncbi:MAG: hypothetical protein A3F69_00315 [Acidobacteria bacterium RIFCSPLOWO2_12_FULL_66_10]|nr:MAG: hypothetical protein A3F69_00315 [Acidobacteria bacterium RIFCSPLOWO2_12_FULL_66_10]
MARHQPHPPGYPLFILAGKAVHHFVPAEASALSLLSIVAGALGVLAIVAFFRRLERVGGGPWPLAAAGVAMTAPLYWFTAGRPMSDVAGLTAAVAVQAMTLGATTVPAVTMAGFCAGLATGVRSQAAWLTVPLLVLRVVQGQSKTGRSPASAVRVLAAFVAGALVWAVPLVVVSGGPAAYWHALFAQGAEDLGNIQMLWTGHDPRAIVEALYYAFVAPWAAWPLAAVVLALAAIGLAWSVQQARAALLPLAVAFGPYLVFDLLFQETFTGRYALPLVIPMAYLAVAGVRWLPRQSGVAVAIALAMFDAHASGTSLAAYSRQKAPAFRLLDDVRAAKSAEREAPVLAMDRRQSFDLRRPMAWVGDAMPSLARTLPAPPQHEWLEAVKYWNGGGRAPVWFVVDPKRTSIDLVQHGPPTEYRWSLPYPALMSGVRPNEMDFYRVDAPDWYVGEGWALTPEAAGVSDADRRGLASIDGWVRRVDGVLMIGGRNFDPAARPRVGVAIDGQPRDEFVAPPGPFLRFVPLSFTDSAPATTYATVTVRASAHVAIEQFDASSSRPLAGFGDGWHEREFNPRTGRGWRWLSERGELRIHTRTPRVVLHLEGESPRTYFSRASHLVVRSAGRAVYDERLASDFSLDIPIADAADAITFETDQVFVPSERSRKSADRRHLGLRIFRCELRPASP